MRYNPDMHELETELRTFHENRDRLLTTDEGKFVLIKGTVVVGTYNDQFDAIAEGYRRFGNVEFFTRQILRHEEPLRLVSIAEG